MGLVQVPPICTFVSAILMETINGVLHTPLKMIYYRKNVSSMNHYYACKIWEQKVYTVYLSCNSFFGSKSGLLNLKFNLAPTTGNKPCYRYGH